MRITSLLKWNSCRQQFILQFLGSARRQLAPQEFFDLARFRVEKLCQDFDVVALPGQPWFQPISIFGKDIVDHIRSHRFLADLVSFFKGTRQIKFELQWG